MPAPSRGGSRPSRGRTRPRASPRRARSRWRLPSSRGCRCSRSSSGPPTRASRGPRGGSRRPPWPRGSARVFPPPPPRPCPRGAKRERRRRPPRPGPPRSSALSRSFRRPRPPFFPSARNRDATWQFSFMQIFGVCFVRPYFVARIAAGVKRKMHFHPKLRQTAGSFQT